MATLRFKVVEDAIKRKALDVPAPEKTSFRVLRHVRIQ